VRVLTELRAKHAQGGDGLYYGIDGNSGKIADMKEVNVWDPLAVKQQTFKTAIESACMLLRIDDIVSGIKKERKAAAGTRFAEEDGGEGETFGDQRDG
jgi:T-complex protein 1 subunit gamma